MKTPRLDRQIKLMKEHKALDELTVEGEESLKEYTEIKQLLLHNVVGRSEQLAHCTDDDHKARRFFGGEKRCSRCGHPLR